MSTRYSSGDASSCGVGACSRWTRSGCARAQAAADRIRAANADAWRLADELSPYVAQACRAAVALPYPVNRYAAPVS